jgi:hypothetical protein
VDRDLEELLRSILREIMGDDETCGDPEQRERCDGEPECRGGKDFLWFRVLAKLHAILCLLRHRRYGLREIKREIKEIEEKMNGNGNGNGIVGSQSTGPILIRTGQNNAINVKVQNVGEGPVTVHVRLVDHNACPPAPVQTVSIADIAPCCAQDAVLTADAGNFEIVVCAATPDARIRVFVSVHSGNSTNSAFEYVIRASEMLPLVCPFCEIG